MAQDVPLAGVASMNVTLGVPRLTEIINASKNISTPIITAHLDNPSSTTAARRSASGEDGAGEICKSMKEVYGPRSCYVSVELDATLIADLHLDVDAAAARKRVLQAVMASGRAPPVIRALKNEHVLLNPNHRNVFRVELPDDDATRSFAGGGGALRGAKKPPGPPARGARGKKAKKAKPRDDSDEDVDPVDQRDMLSDDRTYFAMQALKSALPSIVAGGVSSINRGRQRGRGVVAGDLPLVEGYGLADVMGTPGAARSTIANEITYIMSAYGIGIDARHLMLLSDVMTFKGVVLGITRFGVSKMRESVLMLASFERTTDHLFDAAAHGRRDNIVGVSECIIMGIPIPLGCGSFKLLRDTDAEQGDDDGAPKRRPLIMAS
ncbi:DNA-directed 5'-3' RNA polymerase [Aureococcus anophagefferens]|nr:DNA-directed 5'-3' RNA polymerase [Aureococcus anophagefferens]